MKKFFSSIAKSLYGALAQNEYIVSLLKKYPKLFDFLKLRLSLTKQYGFYFSIAIALSFLFFSYFFSLAKDIFLKGSFLEADGRIMNLIASLRDMSTAKVLLLFTYLGNWEILLILLFVVIFFLYLRQERRTIIFFVVAYFVGGGVQFFLKLIFHRPRPDIGYSLISANSFSFPSGHALLSLLFYGFLSYWLYKNILKSWRGKFFMLITFFSLIFLIGFSRMYLGVHWTSDVLAGWALGMAMLFIFVAVLREKNKFIPEKKTRLLLSEKIMSFTFFLLLVAFFVFAIYSYSAKPLQVYPAVSKSEQVKIHESSNLISTIKTDEFPKHSENLIGQKMEPISLIVVANKEDLISAFSKTGWYISEKVSSKTIFRLAVNAALNKPYPNGPVTPSFLNAQPEDIAFEKPTSANTLRQRHHTRFWQTNYFLEDKPIWIATASFDDGLRYFVTHKIKPDIDTEREYIKDDLESAGLSANIELIQLVSPMLGHNQGYDQFFTDGKAYVFF